MNRAGRYPPPYAARTGTPGERRQRRGSERRAAGRAGTPGIWSAWNARAQGDEARAADRAGARSLTESGRKGAGRALPSCSDVGGVDCVRRGGGDAIGAEGGENGRGQVRG